MWFSSPRNAPRHACASKRQLNFRPRLETLEDRCMLSAGTLDPTFGSGGLVVGAQAPFGPDFGHINVAVVQPDGKILYGGRFPGSNGNNAFALWRYNADGSVDTAFGNNGMVSTAIGPSTSDIRALALQGDGKIVAVGDGTSTSNLVDSQFALARYNSDGSLDSTFGSNGIVVTYLGSLGNLATAVAIDGSGKIDVAGFNEYYLNGKKGKLGQELALVRYNVNGTLDTTFGNKGTVLTQPNSNYTHIATALAIQSDGKIVVAGNTPQAMEVVRYTPMGQLDATFGSSGIVTGLAPSGSTSAEAMRVLVQSNGGIAVAGLTDLGVGYKLTVARLSSTGRLDTTFGSAGFAINSSVSVFNAGNYYYDFDLLGFVQEANGDLLASGYTVNGNGNTDIAIAAFLPTGAPDTAFGAGGTATADFGGNDYAYTLAIQSDGKILVAGVTTPIGSSTHDVALARFLAS